MFWQDAPWRHGLFTHSLMSTSQVCPGGGVGGAGSARPPQASRTPSTQEWASPAPGRERGFPTCCPSFWAKQVTEAQGGEGEVQSCLWSGPCRGPAAPSFSSKEGRGSLTPTLGA